MQKKAETPSVIPYPEYMLRILFATFYPAVKMAVDFNYPLDTVKDMMTLALWREAKRKHSTINLISLIFGKSTRTVKALSARFNKGRYFEMTETNLMRRMEDLLRQHPMTLDELAARLPHSNEFDSARLTLKALLSEGRVEELPGQQLRPRYRVVERHHNLYTDDNWELRIDALYEHLEAVTETIRQRFLDSKPERATARTFSFRARPQDMARFQKDLLHFLRSQSTQLEERVEAEDEAEVYFLYMGSAPVPQAK